MTPGLDHAAALRAAAVQAGVDTEGAEIIKIGDNALYRLPHQIVARVSRPGRTAAFKEVAVARWLARLDVPAVRVLDELDQPIQIDGRCITFWQELPPHHCATNRQVAIALRRVHSLSPPDDVALSVLDPFVGLNERLEAAVTLQESERSWLTHHLATVRESYKQVAHDRERARVLHGDAHGGNIVATTDGEVMLLDFERVAVGPPEWDLVSLAVESDSITWGTAADYAEFVDGYGEDVKNWPHYELFRSIRELRMTCYVAELANDHPAARDEARFRVECLRGEHGDRPWPWTPM